MAALTSDAGKTAAGLPPGFIAISSANHRLSVGVRSSTTPPAGP